MRGRLPWTVLTLAMLAALPACATRVGTMPATHRAPVGGYRFDPDATDPDNTNELFVVVCLSGGGTRAAAMGYGVLQELASTSVSRPDGTGTVRLLDEVDVMSGVSGGAFVAGYYGAFGDRLFRDFPRKVLHRDIEGDLFKGVLSHPGMLFNGYYDRVDLAADRYNELIFCCSTFGSMRRRAARPFVMLNAANVSTGSVFTFTQDTFDFLGSNLDPFPIARAVAASSAVPGVFSPVTLRNHPARPDFTVPAWVRDGRTSPNRFQRRAAESLICYHEDKEDRRYLHLLDGGISDNTGLAPIREQYEWGFIHDLLARPPGTGIRSILVLLVNAGVRPDLGADRLGTSPGPIDSAMATVNAGLRNTTVATIQGMDDLFRARDGVQGVRHHFVEVNLEAIADVERRNRLLDVPTRLTLPRDQVCALIAAGSELLRTDRGFQAFLTAWNAPSPIEPLLEPLTPSHVPPSGLAPPVVRSLGTRQGAK